MIIIACALLSSYPVFCQKNNSFYDIDSFLQKLQKTWIKYEKDTSKWKYFDGETLVIDSLKTIIRFDDFQKQNSSLAQGYFSNIFKNKHHKLILLDNSRCFLERTGTTYSIYFPNGLCRMEIRLLTRCEMIIARSQSDDCDVLIEEEYFPYKR